MKKIKAVVTYVLEAPGTVEEARAGAEAWMKFELAFLNSIAQNGGATAEIVSVEEVEVGS